MRALKITLSVTIIAFASVGAAALLGYPEEAGFFGAIIAVGIYAAHGIKEQP
tara:strand:+ start:729 stop:884 length:156 start_codon:yes stop_codon:yes gene_type:complete